MMNKFLKAWIGVLLIILFCVDARAAEQAGESHQVAPTQAGPAHPGPRPILDEGETQKEYSQRIAVWEQLMMAYERSGGSQDAKEVAARAEMSSNTPDEAIAAALAELIVKMREQIPGAGKDLSDIAKKIILPQIEQESVVLPGGAIKKSYVFSRELLVSADSRYIGTLRRGSRDGGGNLEIWDMFNAQPIVLEDVNSAAFLPGNRLIVVLSDKNEVQILNIVQGNLETSKIFDFKDKEKYKGLRLRGGSYLKVSPDGRYVAINKIYDGREDVVLAFDLQTMQGYLHGGEMFFSSHNGVLSYKDVAVCVSPKDDNFLVEFVELKGAVQVDMKSLELTPDGRYLIGHDIGTIRVDNKVLIWDMHNLEKPCQAIDLDELGRILMDICCLPRGDYLAVDSRDNPLMAARITRIYNLDDLDAQPITLDTNYQLYSPDNRYGLHIGYQVNIHDIQYPHLSKQLEGSFKNAVFLPNDKYLVTQSSNGEVRLWNWRLVTQDLAKQRAAIEEADPSKKQQPGESWFDWTKRLRQPAAPVEENKEGGDSDDE